MEAKIEHSLCRQSHSITTSMNRCFFIVVILTMFSGILVAEIFDMDAICDPSRLDIEVLQDGHRVEGEIETRQKLVTINVGELWLGQDFRVPVRMVVPAHKKAQGVHLTGGSTPDRLQEDFRPNGVFRELLNGGVGLVFTVVQEPGSYGKRDLARAAEERFARTLNPHFQIQYCAWPSTLMRAITASSTESDHFEIGKVAVTCGSNHCASPSMVILHDDRMTDVNATD